MITKIGIAIPFLRNLSEVILSFNWGTPTIKTWGETTNETWG